MLTIAAGVVLGLVAFALLPVLLEAAVVGITILVAVIIAAIAVANNPWLLDGALPWVVVAVIFGSLARRDARIDRSGTVAGAISIALMFGAVPAFGLALVIYVYMTYGHL